MIHDFLQMQKQLSGSHQYVQLNKTLLYSDHVKMFLSPFGCTEISSIEQKVFLSLNPQLFLSNLLLFL